MNQPIERAVGPGEPLQQAVDEVARAGGGTVRLAPGTYELRDSLHLRAGVRVRGAGADTVLRKSAAVGAPLVGYQGYGHFDITVAEPDLFEVGMGVWITDDRSMGFYDTVATLTWRDGNTFGLSRCLNHDYGEAHNGRMTSVFPVVSGYDLRGAGLTDLVIDGARHANPEANGCRGGGVFLYQAHDCVLRDLVVRDYHGDGISFQQCRDLLIEDCVVHGHGGAGLHPGSGSVGAIMRGLVVRDNDRDGVYFCLRVSHCLLVDCVISGNGHNGVSIGERDTDNELLGCAMGGNGWHGIYFRPCSAFMGAHRNLVRDCEVGPNGHARADVEICLEDETRDVALIDNRITPAAGHAALRLGERCRGIVARGNAIPEGARFIEPEHASRLVTESTDNAGPAARTKQAERHLGAGDV